MSNDKPEDHERKPSHPTDAAREAEKERSLSGPAKDGGPRLINVTGQTGWSITIVGVDVPPS